MYWSCISSCGTLVNMIQELNYLHGWFDCLYSVNYILIRDTCVVLKWFILLKCQSLVLYFLLIYIFCVCFPGNSLSIIWSQIICLGSWWCLTLLLLIFTVILLCGFWSSDMLHQCFASGETRQLPRCHQVLLFL